MTKEERQLLLKDICARLPYGVILANGAKARSIDILTKIVSGTGTDKKIEDTKYYLRPMSSMTEEEKKELKSSTCSLGTGYFDEKYLICPMNHYGEHISYEFMSEILDWLNKKMFDYRGLIPIGLALEAPEGMYKTE